MGEKRRALRSWGFARGWAATGRDLERDFSPPHAVEAGVEIPTPDAVAKIRREQWKASGSRVATAELADDLGL